MAEYSLRLRISGAGDDVSTDINYGTLGRAGTGAGVATTGTSIVSGDNAVSPRFQIILGVLCLTTAGASLGLPEAPYHLTLNTGEVVNVTAISGAAHIADQSEIDHWLTRASTALAGLSLRLRPLAPGAYYQTGVDGNAARLRRADFGGLEIRSDDPVNPAVVDRFILRGTRNVAFRYLDSVEATYSKFIVYGEAANNATGITIEYNRLRGTVQDPNGDFSNGLLIGAAAGTGYYPNTDAVVVQGSDPTTRAPWCGDITIRSNWITDCARGINVSGCGLGQLTTSGNLIDRYYDDGINNSYAGPYLWTLEFNTTLRPIGKGTDGDGAGPGEDGPHVDAYRGTGSRFATTNFRVKIRGNISLKGGSRGDVQHLLLSDMKSGGVDSGYHFVGEVTGNVFIGDSTQALSVENAGDGFAVINNTAVADTTSPVATTSIKVGTGSTDSTATGTQIIQRNITDGLLYAGTPTLADNIVLGKGGVTIPYTTVFDGASFASSPTGVSDALTRYAVKSGGPGDLSGQFDAGAIGSGAVTWPTAIPGFDGTVHVIPSVRRDTYVVSFDGSSSTQGNQDGLGHFGTLLTAAVPGTQSVVNQGAGGSLIAGVKTRIAASTAAQKAGTWFIQYDTNSWYASPELGKAEVHYADFVNNVVPLLDAAAVSGKRFLAWVGTEFTYGSARNARNRRFQKLLWNDYPGQVLSQLDYFALCTPDPTFTSVTAPYVGATDTTTMANGQIPVSKQIADRSHQDIEGYTWSNDNWIAPFVKAIEGGAPFYAFYPYYSTASTAQTNGGAVCQLYGVGDTTGATYEVLTMAGATHPHFSCDSAGVLSRASATVLKDQFYPFKLRVSRGGQVVDCPMRVAIGSLTGVPQRKTVDGHTWATLETNDNRGTALAPSFSGARLWAGLGDSDYYEQSVVIDFEPTVDGTTMFFIYQGSGIQIQKLPSNQVRVSNRDKSGVAHGQITTSSGGGLATVANGRFLLFYSIKVDSGVAFQQLILDNGTATIRHTAPTVAPAGLTVNVNPLAIDNALMRFLAGTTDGGSNGVTLPTTANNVIGKPGFMWMSAKAVDWSVAANRGLFRNSLSDLIDLTTAATGLRPGDGRSIIVQPGGLGYNAGQTVTPYYYDRGGAADFGRNFGTGGDVDVWSRTDPTGATPGQGIAVTV